MASWTRATLLRRLAEAVADELNRGRDPELRVGISDVLDGDALEGMSAAELVDLVKRAVLWEAMGR